MSLTSTETQEQQYPLDDWVFVAAAEVDSSLALYQSLEMLPPAHLAALRAYVRGERTGETAKHSRDRGVFCRNGSPMYPRDASSFEAGTTQPAKGEGWLKREEEERPVAWRAIEGLTEALRLQLRQDAVLQDSKTAPSCPGGASHPFCPSALSAGACRPLA